MVRQPEDLVAFAEALEAAVALAIDTETHMATGAMRVLSAATRCAAGLEQAWVVDGRDFPPVRLAPLLAGRTAAAWNAGFDAQVVDTAVFEPAGTPASGRLRWWDAMFADALLHQGRSGFGFYHGLAWASRRYLGVDMEGKGTVQLSFDLTSRDVFVWATSRTVVEEAQAVLESTLEVKLIPRVPAAFLAAGALDSLTPTKELFPEAS